MLKKPPASRSRAEARRAGGGWPWRVVVIGFLVQALSAGLVRYAFSVIIHPVSREFDSSQALAQLAATAQGLVTAMLAPLVGPILDRGSIRLMMIGGVIALSTGLWLISLATAMWMIVAVYGTLIACSVALLNHLAASTLIAQWVPARLAFALGIAALGTSIGGLLIPPLIHSLIEINGWRAALRLAAIPILIVLPPIIWWGALDIRNRNRSDTLAARLPSAPGWTTGALLAQANFWYLAAAAGLVFAVYAAFLSNLLPIMLSLGATEQQATMQISTLALSGVLGKLLFGQISPWLGLRGPLAATALIIMASQATLWAMADYRACMLAAAGMGLAAGGLLPAWGSLLSSLFGTASYGKVMGWMLLAMMPLSLVLSPLTGAAFDLTGTYTPALAGFIVAMGMALIALSMVRPQSVERGFGA